MKQYLIIGASSLLSALLAILIYRVFDEPREVIIRETVPARYTNFDPMDVSKQRLFLSSSPTDFTAAAESVTPAVVNIKTVQGGGGFDFWGGNTLGSASGSGVIISPEGYIVTNNHVIEDSDDIEVTLNDKREFEAELIGTDPSTDLALIKIKGKGLPFMEFGNSDSLRVGEWVIAVGNPFNLESTVTAGIVSAKGRSIDILEGQDRIESFIQTDAAVNPGNSGGALVNTNGELIGINTAIITRSGRYEGYSFAVPSNLARKVIRDLKDFGLVQRGILGVFIDEITNERARELGLKAVEGVFVTRVTPGSGADDAGMRKGDVIVGINGVVTKTLPEMQEQLGRYRPGNSVTVDFIRNGKKQTASVLLKNKSNSTALVTEKNVDVLTNLGFELRELTREERRRLKTDGVKVISIYRGSRIERTNMDPGFIITKIDNKPIGSVDGVMEAFASASGKVMLEGVYESYPGEYYYAFPID
ncbi:MAG: Do family serine endopeptidase [Lewinellaceae bacterium]|nr:Do family serine endopeptidase [Phaeodactylibacter sp.]MCB9039140.1 Do family serine endopeptidase [Lewinellaceae bacterium]